MKERLINFTKSNYPLIILIFYGIFLIFYKWSGSFMGDEAVYSQVAKESLADKSFFILHWKGQLWFEKPPLLIWLTALVFSFFGISETSAHIFPGIFGILSATILYFIGREMWHSRLAGFFSAFIFMTTPIIFLYNRVAMMDVPVGMFIALCVLATLKIFSGHGKWWLVFGASLGLGIMAKSAIGLFPIFLLLCLVFIYQKKEIFKDKFLAYGAVLSALIAAPWHLYMTIKFGNLFWRDYFGFHIWKRFSSQIFLYPGESSRPYAYFKLFSERSGIWIWLFIIFALCALGSLIIAKKRLLAKKQFNSFRFWIKSRHKEWLFLFAWILLATIPFFAARTKLPNYMVLAFFPLALSVGGFLAYAFENNKKIIIYLVSVFSLLNFLPAMRLNASDFGEAHLFFPKFFIRFLGFGEKELLYLFLFSLLAISFLFLKSKQRPSRFRTAALIIILGMNLLIPFNPYRNEFIKNFAHDLARFSDGRPINLYLKMGPAKFAFSTVGAFYLPLRSTVETMGNRTMKILNSNTNQYASLCFIENNYLDNEAALQAVIYYNEGVIVKCQVTDGMVDAPV